MYIKRIGEVILGPQAMSSVERYTYFRESTIRGSIVAIIDSELVQSISRDNLHGLANCMYKIKA